MLPLISEVHQDDGFMCLSAQTGKAAVKHKARPILNLGHPGETAALSFFGRYLK